MTALPLPTEAECQTAIIEAAHMFGYRVHHQRPSGSFIAWSPDGERLAEVIFSPRIHRPFTLMEILTDFICADQGQVSE